MKHKIMKCNSKPSVQKPAMKGESNKLIGLATEAEVRRVQDIRAGL